MQKKILKESIDNLKENNSTKSKNKQRSRIEVHHIKNAIKNNSELNKLLN